MCDCVDGRCPVWEWRVVTPRSPRKCDACREIIPAGVACHWLSSVFRGTWEHTRHCVRCHAIWLLADERLRGTDMAASLTLDCGEGSNDEAAQALAFWLPTDAPVTNASAVYGRLGGQS